MEFFSKSLTESNELLNSVLNNINSAVFIVNNNFKIVSFNNAFKSLFYKEDADILNKYCGNALGCVFVYREKVDCGGTSHCDKCHLRKNILNSFIQKVPVFKQKMIRDFVINDLVITKYLEFSTKHITYHDETYTLIIIDDVTDHELQKQEIISKAEQLAATKMELEQAYQKLQNEEALMLKLEQQSSIMAMIVTANHEINQPLAVLKGNLGLIKSQNEKTQCFDGVAKYIARCEKAVTEIASILKKYRDSETNFDFRDYTGEIKMVDFKENISEE